MYREVEVLCRFQDRLAAWDSAVSGPPRRISLPHPSSMPTDVVKSAQSPPPVRTDSPALTF